MRRRIATMILVVSSPPMATPARSSRLSRPRARVGVARPVGVSRIASLHGVRTASPDTSSRNGVARDLSECGVVWWRRPQSFVIHDAVGSAVDRAFAFTEDGVLRIVAVSRHLLDQPSDPRRGSLTEGVSAPDGAGGRSSGSADVRDERSRHREAVHPVRWRQLDRV